MSTSDIIKKKIVTEWLDDKAIDAAGLCDDEDKATLLNEKSWKRFNKTKLYPGKKADCHWDYEGVIEDILDSKKNVTEETDDGYWFWKVLVEPTSYKYVIFRAYVLKADMGRDAAVEVISDDNDNILAYKVCAD